MTGASKGHGEVKGHQPWLLKGDINKLNDACVTSRWMPCAEQAQQSSTLIQNRLYGHSLELGDGWKASLQREEQ